MTIRLTEDHAHVLLDTIEAFRRHALEASNVNPWDDYDAGEQDDKTSERGWRTLLDEAEEFMQDMLARGVEVEA